MSAYSLRAALLVAAAIGLSGCAYNGLYSGVSVGVSNGYYDPYYGYGYGSRYGYSRYGFDPYWGWYDGFYYPGTGYYIYDRYRRPYRWSDRHRRYWEARRERTLAEGFRRIATDNWEDFDNDSTASTVRRSQIERSVDSPTRVQRVERRDRPSRVERSQARSERGAVRLQRQDAREQRRSETRTERTSRSNGRGRDNSRDR